MKNGALQNVKCLLAGAVGRHPHRFSVTFKKPKKISPSQLIRCLDSFYRYRHNVTQQNTTHRHIHLLILLHKSHSYWWQNLIVKIPRLCHSFILSLFIHSSQSFPTPDWLGDVDTVQTVCTGQLCLITRQLYSPVYSTWNKWVFAPWPSVRFALITLDANIGNIYKI